MATNKTTSTSKKTTRAKAKAKAPAPSGEARAGLPVSTATATAIDTAIDTVSTAAADDSVAQGGGQKTAPGADAQPVLRKKELFERVVTVSGAKKRDVKSIVEATLQVLGDALASGEALALPPLGRAKVNRHKDLATGEMLVVRLRRNAESGGESGGAAGEQAYVPIAETTQ